MIVEIEVESAEDGLETWERLSELGSALPRVASVMPDVVQAIELLPRWLREQFAPEMSAAEAHDWTRRWRSAPAAQRAEMSAAVWSAENWLYWIDPSNAVWRWRAVVKSERTKRAVIFLEVDSWPTALASLEFAVRASGAVVVAPSWALESRGENDKDAQ